MNCRHFRLSLELSGAIAKRLSHAKNQLSDPGSFFNQFVIYIYIYINAFLAIHLRWLSDGNCYFGSDSVGRAREEQSGKRQEVLRWFK